MLKDYLPDREDLAYTVLVASLVAAISYTVKTNTQTGDKTPVPITKPTNGDPEKWQK